jgi:hypothetical protein
MKFYRHNEHPYHINRCDPINAICYELTEGGELVRGKPHTWEALKSHVWHQVGLYEDLKNYTQGEVNRFVTTWLQVVEGKINVVPRSLP